MSAPVPAFPLPSLLKQKRNSLGLTLRATASEIRTHFLVVRGVEHGRLPRVLTLLAVCRWLGVSMEYAVTGQDPVSLGCGTCVSLRGKIDAIRKVLS